MLQKYDAERDELMSKQIAAAAWGRESNSAAQPNKPAPANGRKQTMTQQDIMRKYGK